MSTLSRIAGDKGHLAINLRLITRERHYESIFEWAEGCVRGYLVALNDVGRISDDELDMALGELADLRAQWRVIK